LEPRKTDRDIDYYFYAANRLQPIRSSIPGAIRNAEKSAASARTASRVFAGIGILAILALVVALLALFAQIYGNFHATIGLAGTVSTNADQAKADATRAIADSQAIRQELGTVRMQMEDLRGQLRAVGRELERLRSLAPTPTRPTK
jgi:hypothetical protein